jgi:hypothetical protein
MMWFVILCMGLLAGTVGGVVGFGGSIILLPVLVFAFGPLEAVPIMGVAGFLANLSRVAVWWRAVDWRAAAAYSATGLVGVTLGVHTFVALNPRLIDGLLGVFMLAMIPARRWLLARNLSIGLKGLAVAGGIIGFITGLVASTGPISTPAFLSYGLMKGAFIATEAMGSFSIYAAKSALFHQLGALPAEVALKGLVVGGSMMLGSWAGKRILLRIDAHDFQRLMDGLMLLAGLALVWNALG